jgi:hypothetical protein
MVLNTYDIRPPKQISTLKGNVNPATQATAFRMNLKNYAQNAALCSKKNNGLI